MTNDQEVYNKDNITETWTLHDEHGQVVRERVDIKGLRPWKFQQEYRYDSKGHLIYSNFKSESKKTLKECWWQPEEKRHGRYGSTTVLAERFTDANGNVSWYYKNTGKKISEEEWNKIIEDWKKEVLE